MSAILIKPTNVLSVPIRAYKARKPKFIVLSYEGRQHTSEVYTVFWFDGYGGQKYQLWF